MMDIERRALYNLLRMNWLVDPSTPVKSWQVDDYRKLSLESLFNRLKEKKICLEKTSFLALAENFDSPEDMADELVADVDAGVDFDVAEQDQVYLLVFEIWRKLILTKPCLSIFCDELDYQIYSYDTEVLQNPKSLHDVLSQLDIILDENLDLEGDPVELFACVSKGCANNVENFLYDFIAEQIDSENYTYASELLDDFIDYVQEPKWFIVLKTHLFIKTDNSDSPLVIQEVINIALSEDDLEFTLEALSLIVKIGDDNIFIALIKHAMPLLEIEDDFQDLLAICADYYHCSDDDNREKAIQKILKKRANKALDKQLFDKDPDLTEFFSLVLKDVKVSLS